SLLLILTNYPFHRDDIHILNPFNTLPIFTAETTSGFNLILQPTFALICGAGWNFAPFRGIRFI
ncbi:hypothetical protein, partial [Enterobacter mori]|uniref:hypothetical protein n=1 Tax=Enterobacter mori TaxID=539813 RepID=UPI003D6E79FD